MSHSMTSQSLNFGVAVVRAWTRFYTWRMEPAVGAARREEIESDLWEYEHDSIPDGLHPAWHVLARLILGMPSDLGWRLEHIAADQGLPRRAALAAAVIVAAALWIVPIWLSRGEPTERTRVDECATASDGAPTGSLTRADYRMRVVACAGAFLAGRAPAPGPQ